MLNGMKILSTTALWILACVTVLLSATINWRFGHDHLGGNDPTMALVIACLICAADLLKATLPVVIRTMRDSGKWALSLPFLFVLLCLLSAWASYEVNSQGRAQGIGAQSVAQIKRDDLVTQRNEAREELNRLPVVRPTTMIVEDIEAVKLDRRWTSSAGCTDATTTKSRSYCRYYRELEAELAGATRAEHLRQVIADQSEKISNATTVESVTRRSAAAHRIAEWTGLLIDDVFYLQVLVIAVVLEIASATAPFVAYWTSNYMMNESSTRSGTHKRLGEQNNQQMIGSEQFLPGSSNQSGKPLSTAKTTIATHPVDTRVESFVAEHFVVSPGSTVSARDLNAAISQHCERHGHEVPSQTRVGTELRKLGYKKKRNGPNGNTYYVDVRLTGM